MSPLATLLLVASALTPQVHAIVGGTPAAKNDFPSMVAVLRASFQCGGSLIGPRAVLTSASCVDGLTAASLKVRGGSLKQASGGALAPVRRISIHPDFDAASGTANLAVLHLGQALSDRPAALPLPLVGGSPAAGTSVNLAGWGTVSNGASSLPSDLRKVTTMVVAKDVCQKSFPDRTIGSGVFCHGAVGKGSCQKDEGGPVISGNGIQVGVISVNSCGSPGKQSIATSVESYGLWIDEQLLLDIV